MNDKTRLLLALLAALLIPGLLTATEPENLIPYEKFRLDNGLTVVVHTDRKAPIVAVNLWYHVGSKNEKPGRTGFAHLFEHLMFQGSENFNDEYFGPFEQVGATSMNGTTNFDRTNYFQNVPTTALDLALWMESDRMGHLLGVIDQARLDEQRGVVQNEKRQSENRPYGRVWESVFRASFPAGHPYRWMPIGSMEDLNAASLEDVRNWFKSYYGAANAILVLAGDIDAGTAREQAQKYFGHIPAGPTITRPATWVAPRNESTREIMYDRVAQPRVYRFWNTPQEGTADAELLVLAGGVLGGGKTSRLYERLVYSEQIADTVSAGQTSLEIAGLFGITADVKAGVAPAQVEQAIEEELRTFIAKGPSDEELERARTTLRSGFLRGLERIGGFGGKADVLAACEVYAGDPGCYASSLEIIESATTEQVREAAERWLSHGDHTLEVRPQAEYRNAAASAVDRRTGVPQTTTFPDVAFPELQRATLKNGIPVVLANRPGLPLLRVSLLFEAGYVADQGRELGTSSFTMSMLDEGTRKLDALQIAEKAEALGASLAAGSSLDTSFAAVAALKENLDASLKLFSEVVRYPEFPQKEIERVRKQWVAGIAREKTSPESLALRVLPPLMYGEMHPYGMPLSGSGTEASISSLTREDLVAFHRDWIRPDNATVIVTGDVTLQEVLPALERRFGDWRPPSSAKPAHEVPAAKRAGAARVFLIDKPGAIQSNIMVGQVMASSKAPNQIETDTMNDILAGTFTSRINMNLREDKHWSYGARASLLDAQGERPWLMSAPVQTDKTSEAIVEIRREIDEYLSSKPATAEEITKIKNREVRSLSGKFETNSSVSRAIAQMIMFDRPDDYVRTLKSKIEAQTDDGVRAAARESLRPAQMTWVIVGDLQQIEQPIRALDWGEVHVLDSHGQLLR